MRRLLLFVVLFMVSIAGRAGPSQRVTLAVQNMNCAICPITVKKALQAVPGVTDTAVDLNDKSATVTFDPDQTDAAALIKATTNAGYPASVRSPSAP